MGTVRVAAVGDLHVRAGQAGRWRGPFTRLAGRADVLLLAGDLTDHGTLTEARLLADDLHECPIPVALVLGNHDLFDGQADRIAQMWTSAGAHVLDGTSTTIRSAAGDIGIAGICGTTAVDNEADLSGKRLAGALNDISGSGLRIALTHFAPVTDTIAGERPEIHQFLASPALGDAIEAAGADLAVHGHAHRGCESGNTKSAVPVRNVARPVIKADYRIYSIGSEGAVLADPVRMGERARWYRYWTTRRAIRTWNRARARMRRR
jgi:Icc-related predicted phosphoesterase